jgi:hypothetical protein
MERKIPSPLMGEGQGGGVNNLNRPLLLPIIYPICPSRFTVYGEKRTSFSGWEAIGERSKEEEERIRFPFGEGRGLMISQKKTGKPW